MNAQNVYVAVDGPKISRKFDIQKVSDVRQLVSATAWPGKTKFLFRENNLGCRRGVAEAITWFFKNEDEGIILEDDCLPDESFFPFCEELLSAYRDNPNIGVISGTNFFPPRSGNLPSFTFCRYPHIWGWATWKSAWEHYDNDLTGWKSDAQRTILRGVSGRSKKFVKHWDSLLRKVDSGEIDTWDYIWTFSLWKEQKLTVLPSRNLVHNSGFGQGATHTTAKPISKIFNPEASQVEFPLDYPEKVAPNKRIEFLNRELIMGVRGPEIRFALRIIWTLFATMTGLLMNPRRRRTSQ